MNEKPESMVFTRILGCFAIAASMYFTGVALSQHITHPFVYFQNGAGFMLGTAFVLLSFQKKRLGILAGIGIFICLAGVDITKWQAGLESLRDVLILWMIVMPVVGVAIFLLIRARNRKAPTPPVDQAM